MRPSADAAKLSGESGGWGRRTDRLKLAAEEEERTVGGKRPWETKYSAARRPASVKISALRSGGGGWKELIRRGGGGGGGGGVTAKLEEADDL